MTTPDTEVFSALLDGEAVDADRLAAALDDPAARGALIDFVRLRAAVRTGDDPLPASLKSPLGRRTRVRLLRWPAAAAVVVLVFLAGLLAPRPWNQTAPPSSELPPEPARIEKFVPGVDWRETN